MRILHVLDHSLPKISGYSIRSHAILKNLQATGAQVFALTSDRQGDWVVPYEEIENIQYFRTKNFSFVNKIKFLKQGLTIVSTMISVHKAIKHLKPQVIHVHSPCTLGLATWLIARFHGLPILYEIRAFWEDAFNANNQQFFQWRTVLVRSLETFLCQHVDKVIVICKGLAKILEQRNIASEKICIVPNGVTMPVVMSSTPCQNKTESSPYKTIGFIGSFYAYEGVLLLCQAFLKCCETHDGLRLLLLGNGPEFESVKACLTKFQKKNNIELISAVPPDRVQAYYQRCDILVYPRLASPLTDTVTPLKPLEAIVQKKPILFSNVGGLLELIPNPLPDSVFSAGDVDQLAMAIEKWLSNPIPYQQWAETTYAHIQQTRQWSDMIKRYLPEYAAFGV